MFSVLGRDLWKAIHLCGGAPKLIALYHWTVTPKIRKIAELWGEIPSFFRDLGAKLDPGLFMRIEKPSENFRFQTICGGAWTTKSEPEWFGSDRWQSPGHKMPRVFPDTIWHMHILNYAKQRCNMGFMTTICSAWPWLSQSEPDCLCENGFVNKLIRTRMVRIFRLWWSIGDSNPWPQRCERCALPTVLISQMYEADSIQEKCCYSIVEYGLYSFWNLCFVLSGIQTAW